MACRAPAVRGITDRAGFTVIRTAVGAATANERQEFMPLRRREDSELPEKAVWSDEGTDPAADARWLASLQPSARHYRLYERQIPYTFPQQAESGSQESGNLFGVVVIDGNDIEQSRGGLLLPSPSMIGHLDALQAAAAEWNSVPVVPRDAATPLESYRSVGGSLDACPFDSSISFHLGGIRVTQDRVNWQWVRSLGAVRRCPQCNRILPMRYATHCLHCGAWFSTSFDAT